MYDTCEWEALLGTSLRSMLWYPNPKRFPQNLKDDRKKFKPGQHETKLQLSSTLWLAAFQQTQDAIGSTQTSQGRHSRFCLSPSSLVPHRNNKIGFVVVVVELYAFIHGLIARGVLCCAYG